MSDNRFIVGGVARPGGFVAIREPDTGQLLFRFDPERLLIEIVRRRRRTVIDLSTRQPVSSIDKK